MQRRFFYCRSSNRFLCRYGRLGSCCLLMVCLSTGCGNVAYSYRASTAESKLEAARQAGAERTALYEFTLAQEHLKQAMHEASDADYGDAYELARLAETYADQALQKAQHRTQLDRHPVAGGQGGQR